MRRTRTLVATAVVVVMAGLGWLAWSAHRDNEDRAAALTECRAAVANYRSVHGKVPVERCEGDADDMSIAAKRIAAKSTAAPTAAPKTIEYSVVRERADAIQADMARIYGLHMGDMSLAQWLDSREIIPDDEMLRNALAALKPSGIHTETTLEQLETAYSSWLGSLWGRAGEAQTSEIDALYSSMSGALQVFAEHSEFPASCGEVAGMRDDFDDGASEQAWISNGSLLARVTSTYEACMAGLTAEQADMLPQS